MADYRECVHGEVCKHRECNRLGGGGMFNSLYEIMMGKSRRKPLCNYCIHEKKGLSTICDMYKRIPPQVQEGSICGKYKKRGGVDV